MTSEKEKKSSQMLWVESYRPKKIQDCILPEDIKKFFQAQADSGDVQNMLLSGGHGVGKTTSARALCEEIGADYMFMNCSKNNSIEDLRGKIESFSSSMSLQGGQKVLIGDEFDHFSPKGQAALRGVIEAVSNNCRFIFTCNYANKIIEPLKNSRLNIVNFTVPNKEKGALAVQFMKRCCKILDAEGVKYDKKVLSAFVKKHFPDFRRTIQELHRAQMINGEINKDILHQSEGELGPYIKSLKERDYKAARNYITESTIDPGDFFSGLFNSLDTFVDSKNLAEAILLLNKYQYNHAFAVDPELNMAALTIELMGTCNFK